MKAGLAAPESISEYIGRFPADVQSILKKIRAAIRKAAPDAQEKISYQIPTFTLSGNLVHFAAYKQHVGFYPGASAVKKFKREISAYEYAKGTLRLALDQPIPFGLISRIVKFRVKKT